METEDNRVVPMFTRTRGQATAAANRKTMSVVPAARHPGAKTHRASLAQRTRPLPGIEDRVARLPVADLQKVAAIRSAICNGTFVVNTQRIADKLISVERALTHTRAHRCGF